MHPTGGTLRVFRQFAWLGVGSVKMALSRPAHQRVTPTVGQALSKNHQKDVVMDNFPSFDDEALREQLKARNVMKREMLYFYGALILGMILFFVFGTGNGFGVILFFVFLIAFRTATVWYQWNFLIRFKLKCPSCGKPLAEKYNLFISPNHNCPHCGKRALAPIKQLVEFEKSLGG